jgi:hypothetical protein
VVAAQAGTTSPPPTAQLPPAQVVERRFRPTGVKMVDDSEQAAQRFGGAA